MHFHVSSLRIVLPCLMAAFAWEARAAEPQPAVDGLLKELTGQTPATVRTPAQWRTAYRQAVDKLLPAKTYPDPHPGLRLRPPQAILDEVILRGGAIEAQRAPLVQVLVESLEKSEAVNDRVFFLRQLAVVGRAEVVPALTKLLASDDQATRQYARRALEANPSSAAGQALISMAVSKTTRPEDRLAAVNALGQRREAAAVAPLAALTNDPDQRLAAAAMMALGSIGTEAAARQLSDARGKTNPSLAVPLDHACLLCADRLRARGEKDTARPLYRQLCDSAAEAHVRMAALQGLAVVAPEASVPLLIEILRTGDPRRQAQAARLVSELPGREAAQRFLAVLPQLPASAQTLLREALADRDQREPESSERRR